MSVTIMAPERHSLRIRTPEQRPLGKHQNELPIKQAY